jgi:polyisoprenoid-binding protein YceI
MRKMALLMAMMAAMAVSAMAETFKVDPVHTSIVFRIGHLGVSSVYGHFNGASGSVEYDPAAPEKAKFDVQVEAKSVDTNMPQRDDHLRGRDFFDAEKFPTIRFSSTAVKPSADKSLELTGDLTLHGVTKRITVTMTWGGVATDPRGSVRTGFSTQFTIRRSEFGMNNGIPMVGDEVKMMVEIEAVK